jgi:ABC-type antimicrobial peptide transport system permease subunit
MKLNNHGWGLNQMLIYCAILLFFLIIAVMLIIQLSSILSDINITDSVSYSEVEENVSSAAKIYMNKYYTNDVGTGTITITTDNLLKNNILSESDLTPTDESKTCTGYALVKNDTDGLNISSYIKCSNYETNGYQSWRLGD